MCTPRFVIAFATLAASSVLWLGAGQASPTKPPKSAAPPAQSTPPAMDNSALLAREKAVWQSIQDKNMVVFRAALDPAYVAVYGSGVRKLDAELATVSALTIKSFKIENFESRSVDANTQIVSYKATAVADVGGKEATEVAWNSSVWHKSGDRWTIVLHTEADIASAPAAQ